MNGFVSEMVMGADEFISWKRIMCFVYLHVKCFLCNYYKFIYIFTTPKIFVQKTKKKQLQSCLLKEIISVEILISYFLQKNIYLAPDQLFIFCT